MEPLGGIAFTYSKRRSYHRCGLVCGGFTGLHPSGRWSTWSPRRFPIPENDDEFLLATARGIDAHRSRPEMGGGHIHVLIDAKFNITCGNCQLVCVADREQRKKRYEMLTESGCVVQKPDGSVEAFAPGEAA
ncbi:MAG: epoxyqueuosine reductase, partial [Candidatus Hydrogenedentota bacterium]